MTTCTHELGERETACADGMCPICSAETIGELREALREFKRHCRSDIGRAAYDALKRMEAAIG